jgi:hypothetical protein
LFTHPGKIDSSSPELGWVCCGHPDTFEDDFSHLSKETSIIRG